MQNREIGFFAGTTLSSESRKLRYFKTHEWKALAVWIAWIFVIFTCLIKQNNPKAHLIELLCAKFPR
jgi:hypothetical protein